MALMEDDFFDPSSYRDFLVSRVLNVLDFQISGSSENEILEPLGLKRKIVKLRDCVLGILLETEDTEELQ